MKVQFPHHFLSLKRWRNTHPCGCFLETWSISNGYLLHRERLDNDAGLNIQDDKNNRKSEFSQSAWFFFSHFFCLFWPKLKSCYYAERSEGVYILAGSVSAAAQVSNPASCACSVCVVQAHGPLLSLKAVQALSDEMWKTAHNNLEHAVSSSHLWLCVLTPP